MKTELVTINDAKPNQKKARNTIEYNSKQDSTIETLKLSLLSRASCFITKGFYNRAIKDSFKVLEIEPNNDNAKAFICLSFLEMNDISSAEQYLPSNKSLNTYIEAKKREMALQYIKSPSYYKYQSFIKSLYMYDAYFPKIEIKLSTEEYRSVVSKAPIYKNEIIMSIPKECLITLDLAFSTVIGREISSFMYFELNSPKHCLLASFLLTESNDPKWQFYFNILPSTFSHFPIYYSVDEFKLLEGTAFINQINVKKNEMRKDYDTLVGLIPSYCQFTFKQFCEARLIISSRIFGIKMNDKRTDVLAPYADLLNHRRNQQTLWYYDETMKSFIIQAKEDILQGEEIFDSYGLKANSRFLMHYGFVLEDNNNDEYPLTISFNSKCTFFKEKELWIKNAFEYDKTFVISKNLLSSKVIDMFSFLRFIYFKDNMQILYSAITMGQDIPLNDNVIPTFYYIYPLSIENECDVLNGLNQRCSRELLAYPTTIQEDEKLLSNGLLSYNERNCIILRLSEKKVLQFYIEMCNYCSNLLGVSEHELIKNMTIDSKFEEYENYIQDVIWVLSKRVSKEDKKVTQ